MKKIFSVYVLFVSMVLTTLLYASTDFPNTPAGKRAKEVVELLNGISLYELEDYIKNQYASGFRDAFPVATHKGIFQTTQTMFGKVKVVDITKSTENEVSVVLESERGDAWLNLILQVEEDDPHRITLMGLRPGTRPSNSETKEKNQTGQVEIVDKPHKYKEAMFSNLEELHQYLLKKTEKNKFSGTVLIAKDGNPIFQRAYGYASKRFEVPNKLDTKFNLGSINKSFTAVAILQLVEDGKILIDDPIGKYLDIFPQDIADKVTIRHLLNMRSGWGDYWGNEYYLSHQNSLRTLVDYMEFIKDIPLDFEPGTNFQHCNTGFEVAGAIIEKISGMDYFEYIRKNIYESSGMKNTDSYHRDGPVKNLAVGYTNMNSNDPKGKTYQWANTYILSPRGTPAGGGYSTAEDMLKYDQALRNNRLIGKDYMNFMNNRFQGNIGDPHTPRRTSRSAGGAPGMSTLLARDLIKGYTVIVLSNYDFPSAMEVGNEIIKMLGLE